MTDRYSVDALAPQYDEIAGICMMGKPVILTRDNQELVLMNPVEFRKMMQLVSRIQETNKEKEAALSRASELEKELAGVREELAQTKRDLEEAKEAAIQASANSAGSFDEEKAGLLSDEMGDRAAMAEDHSLQAGQEPQASDEPQNINEPQPGPFSNELQAVPAANGLQSVPASQGLPQGPAAEEAASLQAWEERAEQGFEQDEQGFEQGEPADQTYQTDQADQADSDLGLAIEPKALPAPGDHLASFLHAVAESLEKRTQMEMEPVPEGLAIEAVGLTKKYSGVLANSNISLHVPYGAVYGLLGMTGSGRSTLVRNLLGLSFPNSGQITLCNAMGKELNDIRELTGSILDAPVLYEHLSINQNMVFRAKLLRLKTPKPAIKEALKKFGLFDKKRKKVRTLSTGMKQKLALALAILGNPELLILDEPLKGLDAADIATFCNVMMEMNARGSTILITDSRTDGIAGIATHYGILQKGELIQEISAKQILENPIDLDAQYLAGGEV